MKLYSATLIGLLLCSSAVFADTDKETTPTTKNADTARFFGYSTLALANAGMSTAMAYFITDDILSGKLEVWACLLGCCYLIPVPAYLTKSDAQNAWHYYQKAFSANNKIEPTSTCPSNETNETGVSTKKVHAAKLIGYSVFALINLAATALCAWGSIEAYNEKEPALILAAAIFGQASSRLAVRNLYSIREHYRKLFPSKDIKETTHETV
jgi:hypothetical protein